MLLPLAVMAVFSLAPGLWILHDRQPVFKTETVRKPPQGKAGAPKIFELSGAVKGRGIVVNVTVDMFLIGVCRHKESVASLCPAHSQFIADSVRLFRRNFPGVEGQPDLITKHVIFLFLFPPCQRLVACFGKQKFLRRRSRVTGIRGNIFALGFFGILPIVQTVPNSRRDTFPFVCMAGQKCCCCQKDQLLFRKKTGQPIIKINCPVLNIIQLSIKLNLSLSLKMKVHCYNSNFTQ